jgi:hypothetical protein
LPNAFFSLLPSSSTIHHHPSTINLTTLHTRHLTLNTQQLSIMSAEDEVWIDVTAAQDGGILKKITKAAPENAAGPPPKGYEVTAHYTGK